MTRTDVKTTGAAVEPSEPVSPSAADTDVAPDAAPRRLRRPELLPTVERYGLLALLAGCIITFSALPKSSDLFASKANLVNILGSQVSLCVVAVAFTLPLMVGQLDLSIASIAGLASIGTATAMSRFHAPLAVAVVVGILVGVAAGAINGFLIAYLGLDSIIVTLAGMTLIAGLVQWYTDGLSINTNISSKLTDFGSLQWFGIPRITYLLVAVALVAWYLIEMTPFGKYVRMIGSNRSAARLVGLPVRSMIFTVFLISGALAGVTGVLLTARAGAANPQEGPGLLLSALAAVYLGATAIQPGKFNVIGTIVGVFFLAVAVSGLTLLGVPPFVGDLFNGGALLTAVALSRVFGRARGGGVVGT